METRYDIFTLARNLEPNALREACEQGADVNVRNKYNQTALHAMLDNVACYGSLSIKYLDECVRIFLEAHINLELQDREEKTVLHVALLNRRIYAACMFVKAGANMRARNNKGRTCYDIAKERGYLFILQAIIDSITHA